MEKGFKQEELKDRPKIIAITGAESTGKTTLSKALSIHYGVPFEPEFARNYIRDLNRKYTYRDVEIIAKKQLEQYNQHVNSNNPLVILDTWLLITKVWFEVVFKKAPDWIDMAIKKNQVDLFLVCDIDLPWMADEVRENGGENRVRLQKRYIEELEKYQFSYKIVHGTGDIRVQNAISFIDGLGK